MLFRRSRFAKNSGEKSPKKVGPKLSLGEANRLYYSGHPEEAKVMYREMVDEYLSGRRKFLRFKTAYRAGVPFWNFRFSHRNKLAYLQIYKNACTSLSHAIYESEHGHPYEAIDGIDIHKYYQRMGVQLAIEEYDDYYKFAVVRDPIKRFISAFRNRVAHHNDLAKMDAPRTGLTTEPDINYFVRNLEEYISRSDMIETHFLPQEVMLNDGIERLDGVFRIEDMDELALTLSARVGHKVEFGRYQTGGPKATLSDLEPDSFEKLLNFYDGDYDLLESYYSKSTIKDEFLMGKPK